MLVKNLKSICGLDQKLKSCLSLSLQISNFTLLKFSAELWMFISHHQKQELSRMNDCQYLCQSESRARNVSDDSFPPSPLAKQSPSSWEQSNTQFMRWGWNCSRLCCEIKKRTVFAFFRLSTLTVTVRALYEYTLYTSPTEWRNTAFWQKQQIF